MSNKSIMFSMFLLIILELSLLFCLFSASSLVPVTKGGISLAIGLGFLGHSVINTISISVRKRMVNSIIEDKEKK